MLSMARPPVYDNELRERLLAVTADAVDRLGVNATSLRDIARSAETSTSAVYALFGSKEGLLAAVIDDAFTSFGRAQAQAESDGLRALGVAYRSWALDHPPLYRLMFTTTLAGIVNPLSTTPHKTLSPLQRLVTARLPEASEEVRAVTSLAIWSQVHGAVSMQLTGMPLPDDAWEAVYTTVLDGIDAAYPAP